MCGIAGIAGPDAAKHADAVRRMVSALAHRGPDGEGIYIAPSGQCVLGHRRLSILDASQAAAQPMLSPDKTLCLSYNGECYNFKQLRDELSATQTRFSSSGDTEVVLQLLAREGVSGLKRINGMFALALWNETNRTLLLARDRFGQKPLYYASVDGHLIFASEVRAILNSGLVPRKLSLDGVRSFLSYGAVQGPGTIVDGVRLLPKASWLERASDAMKSGSYWEPPADKAGTKPDELRELFSASVQRHLVSDVPVGLFLSGGIDSSAIVATASRISARPIVTLTVTFPDSPSYSEGPQAACAATAAKSRHIEVPVSSADAFNCLPRAITALDQPSIDGLNTYLVSRAARENGLKVTLSGLGGDELFGGYSSFVDVPKLMQLRELAPAPGLLAKSFEYIANSGKKANKFAELFDAPPGLLSAYLVRRRLFSSRQIKRLCPDVCGKGWIAGLDAERLARLNSLISSRANADAIGLLELDLYMGETLLRDSDVMGMSHGLEIRMPFLDAEFSSAALRLSADSRHPTTVPKHSLVKAMGDWLNPAIYSRPKIGFQLPFDDWLTGKLNEQIKNSLMRLGETVRFFSREAIDVLWKRYCASPNTTGWSRPWSLFVLSRYVEEQRMSI